LAPDGRHECCMGTGRSVATAFPKLKHSLRKAQARSYDAFLAAVGYLLDTYSRADCVN